MLSACPLPSLILGSERGDRTYGILRREISRLDPPHWLVPEFSAASTAMRRACKLVTSEQPLHLIYGRINLWKVKQRLESALHLFVASV